MTISLLEMGTDIHSIAFFHKTDLNVQIKFSYIEQFSHTYDATRRNNRQTEQSICLVCRMLQPLLSSNLVSFKTMLYSLTADGNCTIKNEKQFPLNYNNILRLTVNHHPRHCHTDTKIAKDHCLLPLLV